MREQEIVQHFIPLGRDWMPATALQLEFPHVDCFIWHTLMLLVAIRIGIRADYCQHCRDAMPLVRRSAATKS
ncbi:hypothetical protein GQ457_13G007800 [Hibiscus cannabinus]